MNAGTTVFDKRERSPKALFGPLTRKQRTTQRSNFADGWPNVVVQMIVQGLVDQCRRKIRFTCSLDADVDANVFG